MPGQEENALIQSTDNVDVDTAQAGTTTDVDNSQEETTKTERTFTQKELDEILQKRLDKQSRRSDRQLSELKQKLEELTKAREANDQRPKGDISEVKEPSRKDFDTYEEYLEARADYKAEKRVAAQLAEYEKKNAKESDDQRQASTAKELEKLANKRVADGRKEYPDFDSVIQDAFEEGLIDANSEVYYGIVESDMGHRLAYHLSTHPEEAKKLKTLSPRGVQRELGKLEDKLAAAGMKKEKAETMETLEGGRPVKNNDPMREDLSMDDYVKLRNAQERKRRGY